MRVHHLNCISSCPLGGRLMDDRTESVVRRGQLVNHCLLVETDAGLVLVDTGFGMQDVLHPETRLSRFFLTLMKPEFRIELTALRQIERLGFDPRDVRHIVLTHLDFDHAGGLDDFPQASVHLLEAERDSAVQRRTWLDRQRYRPQQWSTLLNWRVYPTSQGQDWFGFERAVDLEGLPPEIVLIPLVGHTFGHAGVAVRRGDGWLLQCGDAYFFHAEMDLERPWCTPGLRTYQRMMEKDRQARLWNQTRLRQLRRSSGGSLEICCAHDPVEFERLSGRSAEVPAEQLVSPVPTTAQPAQPEAEPRHESP
jgi:glyoxylase-like metal-dependent hydrolase (beta-lactamase superfamily II)